jgi:hypothetical protein
MRYELEKHFRLNIEQDLSWNTGEAMLKDELEKFAHNIESYCINAINLTSIDIVGELENDMDSSMNSMDNLLLIFQDTLRVGKFGKNIGILTDLIGKIYGVVIQKIEKLMNDASIAKDDLRKRAFQEVKALIGRIISMSPGKGVDAVAQLHRLYRECETLSKSTTPCLKAGASLPLFR